MKMLKKNKNVVIVHTDPSPLLKYFKRKEVKIILLGTNLKNLARNINKRKDRYIRNILSNEHTGYLFYFGPTNKKENSLFLRKKDLEKIPINTKADFKAIENFKQSFFHKDRKTTRIKPKSMIDYDTFIINN